MNSDDSPISTPPSAVPAKKQERWGSRFGVIMAVAGSAVGLGNFLRFPGQAAQYGGGAFMIAYLVALLLIGLPICWVEWTMGRQAGQHGFHSTPGIFYFFTKNRIGKYLGAIGVVIPFLVFMYYVVIEAWCLGYAVNFLFGAIHFSTATEAGSFFAQFVGSQADGLALGLSLKQVGPYILFSFLLNYYLIYRGISAGIEFFCKISMPALIVIALIILVRVLTLGTPDPAHPQNNVDNGLGFMWNPVKVILETRSTDGKWTKEKDLVGTLAIEEAEQQALKGPNDLRIRSIGVLQQLQNPQLWLAAAGQIFLSLSIGLGVILTYASYLRQNDDVVLSGLSATSANEFCEVALGGLITLPASVAFLGIGAVATMSSTFGLGFHVLPLVFSQMPLGQFFGFLFFFLLFLAAVTSSISLLPPGLAFFEESLQLGRTAALTLLCVITGAGNGFVIYFSKDLKALDTLDFWGGTFLIFVLATVQTLIFGWVWGANQGVQAANSGSILRLPNALAFIIKYVSPTFLLTIFTMWILVNVLGYSFTTKESQLSSYIIDLFVTPNRVAWFAMSIIILLFAGSFWIIARAKMYRSTLEKPLQ